MTIFLKFPDQQTAIQALKDVNLWLESDEYTGPKLNSLEHSLDIIGIITQGGEYSFDESGDMITVVEPITLDGWHINYIGNLPANWEQYFVTPQKPYRVFA
jgi:hypothetical protein